MFRITKILHFSYGHRLLGRKGKCRHLHGHNGTLEVTLESENLDKCGMVVDFELLGSKVKKWLDKNLDHRTILNRRDPAAKALKRIGEPCLLIDAEPTAENLAKMIYESVQKMGFPVKKVKLWETPSSYAVYKVKP